MGSAAVLTVWADQQHQHCLRTFSKTQILGPHSRPTELDTLRVRASSLCFTDFPVTPVPSEAWEPSLQSENNSSQACLHDTTTWVAQKLQCLLTLDQLSQNLWMWGPHISFFFLNSPDSKGYLSQTVLSHVLTWCSTVVHWKWIIWQVPGVLITSLLLAGGKSRCLQNHFPILNSQKIPKGEPENV